MDESGVLIPASVRRAVSAARLALGWERLWQAAWIAICVVGGWVALALLDVLPRLPGWLHGLVLTVTALTLGLLLWRGFRGFRWPTAAEAMRRLERDNGLRHRPLSALHDRLATDDPQQVALWHHHRQALMRQLGRLQVLWPNPGLATLDPLGLRAVVGLALVVTGVGAWGDWGPRLAAALQPHWSRPGGMGPAALDVWLTPPPYTSLPPVILHRADATPNPQPVDDAAGAPISVPAGSVILARVSGGWGTPTLTVNGTEQRFSAPDDSHFQIQQTIAAGSEIAVEQGGRDLGRWAISVHPNQPPGIRFAAPPSLSDHGTLRLAYIADDEYGLASVVATVRAAPGVETSGGTEPTSPLIPASPDTDTSPVSGRDGGPASSWTRSQGRGGARPASEGSLDVSPSRLDGMTLSLPLPGARPKTAHGTSDHDLSASPWAGLPVLIGLTATNGAGQTTHSDEVPLVLPERAFRNPVARQIIAERKALALGGESAREAVAQALDTVSVHPDRYHGDPVVFLALRVAVGQLIRDHTPGTIPAVRDLLWESALRLEDGESSLAERDVRAAEAALAEALAHNASEEELRRRMDDLQAAVDRLLDSLETQPPPLEAAHQPPASPPTAPTVLERTDLEAMLHTLRDMTETGAHDQAQQALANLSRLLDGLKSGAESPDPNQQAHAEILRKLQDLTAQQRNLLDRTFRQSQNQGQASPQSPSKQPDAHTGAPPRASDQEQMRHQLGALMQQMGEIDNDVPASLGDANLSMRAAERALQQNDTAAAIAAESDAVDKLQQGVRGLAAQLNGLSAAQDPLGRLRPAAGIMDSAETSVPEASELQKSREILDELRRRAGQRERSHQELDYIDRLLRPF